MTINQSTDLRDLFPIVGSNKDATFLVVEYLKQIDGVQSMEISVQKTSVPWKSVPSEDDVYREIPKLFDELTSGKLTWSKDLPLVENRVANEIAKNCRRGFGNQRWGDFIFYSSDKCVGDQILVITNHQDQFDIFVNPAASRMIEKLD